MKGVNNLLKKIEVNKILPSGQIQKAIPSSLEIKSSTSGWDIMYSMLCINAKLPTRSKEKLAHPSSIHPN
jgi:hypothetical protein